MKEFNSYRFGTGRYIQEEEVLEYAGQEILRYGKNAYLLTGFHAWEAVKEGFIPSLQASGIVWTKNEYTGFPSYESVEKISEDFERAGCDVFVGIGGGKIMDLSKAVAFHLHVPVVLIPTSSATCAAFSPLSVMYTDEGKCVGSLDFDKEVDEVLVDETVLSLQPPRLAAAGIMDAMAKYIEISNGKPEITLETDTINKFSAYSMAQFTYKILEEYGRQAYLDIEQKKLSPTVHNIIFTTIAVTGVISAMMRGHSQTALAHKLYESLRTLYFKECEEYLHGEIVATGLIMQLKYNHNEEQIPKLKEYMTVMEMPMNLKELGLSCDDVVEEKLCEKLAESRFVEDTDEARRNLGEAMKEIIV
ncbi:MAG: iron-containing alcohol dehydrogenase family protein [Coprococcus sp.]|nr:iron-containing alcohol dehydrogenase family protein [Coprococcus sp.]